MNVRPQYKDEDELIHHLRNGDHQALTVLYKSYYPVIARFISMNSGEDDDARDIYQEAVIIFYNKLQDSTFELHCKIKTYLYSVCRKLWLNELKKKGVHSIDITEIEGHVEFAQEEKTDFTLEEKKLSTMNFSMEMLGEPCRTILHDFYIARLSMNEIRDKMGYTTTDNAKNQKYKCLQRLKKIYFRNLNE
ncbi:MAG: sigma-70 family RNA polymerase sigma factor [Bacteroidota bacterium]